MKKVIEEIKSKQITLVKTDVKYKTKFVIKLVNELGFIRREKTFLYSFRDSSRYYMYRVLSFLSGIEVQELARYFEPCTWFGKGKYSIDRNKFIDAIETIQKSPIVMFSDDMKSSNEEYLEYLFTDRDNDYFIIVGINELYEKCNLSPQEMISKIRSLASNKHIILIMNQQQQDLCSKYVDEVIEIDQIEGDKVSYD